MCLIARHLEENGIPTIAVGSAYDILKAGRAPRSVYVDYPLGHSVGRPFDQNDQRRIVRATLNAFEQIEQPEEIVILENCWSDDDSWRDEATDTNSGDTRAPRDDSPQYQTESDRAAYEQNRIAV